MQIMKDNQQNIHWSCLFTTNKFIIFVMEWKGKAIPVRGREGAIGFWDI
jgi:hypothetical protein